jgi:hypothetical protein
MNETQPCLINAGNFTLGPNTNLTVNGTCELIIAATHAINIHYNSSIKVSIHGTESSPCSSTFTYDLF